MEQKMSYDELNPYEKVCALDQYYWIRHTEAAEEGETFDMSMEETIALLKETTIYVDRDKGTVFVSI